MIVCYLGLGTNLGDRRKNIKLAINKVKLLRDTLLVKSSSVIQTLPCGGPSKQGKYLNSVLKIRTKLTPETLLKELKKIELDLGRPKKHIRFGERIIDLDILFYGEQVSKTNNLEIPHPRMLKRDFVIRPLLGLL